MFKKKIIVIAGASAVIVSLLAGVTYAWFTNTQTQSYSEISTGQLGIEFTVTDEKVPEIPLYPQKTETDPETGIKYPVIEGEIPDVVETIFSLKNTSDRGVLVKINATEWITENLMGSALDEYENAIPGSSVPLEDTSSIEITYSFGNVAEENLIRKGNDAYIFLDVEDIIEDITLRLWINGNTCDNTYQNVTFDASELTAIAVQYRAAAILSIFEDEIENQEITLAEIEAQFGAFE